ncbi:hypothetical protein V2G26_019709 [Clonostachys chloroleuca]
MMEEQEKNENESKKFCGYLRERGPVKCLLDEATNGLQVPGFYLMMGPSMVRSLATLHGLNTTSSCWATILTDSTEPNAALIIARLQMIILLMTSCLVTLAGYITGSYPPPKTTLWPINPGSP